MLHNLFWMLFLAAVYAITSFKILLEASHLFCNMPLYRHMVAILIFKPGTYLVSYNCFVRECLYACVCVFAPEAINN